MINKELLLKMMEDKLVSVQKHPSADLFIYNYTPKVQYDRIWNEITMQTRGLILDSDMNIVSRPFKKFFNLEEHTLDEIPNMAFDVYEKMDGSLGILYWLNNEPFIATRGSFLSEQSMRANLILRRKYANLFDKLDKNSTYLFEIIYPENRIVVNYNDMEDLILLSVIDNETGEERIEDIGFPIVKKYDGIKDIAQLKSLEEDNKEGFVVRFKNGFRLKVKFKEYVRLHRIVTGISNTSIWEYLRDGKDFNEILDRVPDEFYEWVKKTIKELTDEFDAIINESKNSFKILDNRKETAIYFLTQKYPKVLFAMLDGKKIDGIVWKMVKPNFSKPFKID
jgi:RNA ligase